MVVTNRKRTTAIVIRHDGHTVALVPMKAGKLTVCQMSHAQFLADWKEAGFSLANAVDRFLRHARQRGASQEALRGLKRLEKRDRWVVAPLF